MPAARNRALGWPARRTAGVAGRLARDNAIRNPGRTAVTAAALMTGVAPVTFVAVLGEGLRGSVRDAVDRVVQPSSVAPPNVGGATEPRRYGPENGT